MTTAAPLDPLQAVYPARLYAQRGYLAVIDRAWVFLDQATGDTVQLSPADCNWLTTQGPLTGPTAEALRRRQHWIALYDVEVCVVDVAAA